MEKKSRHTFLTPKSWVSRPVLQGYVYKRRSIHQGYEAYCVRCHLLATHLSSHLLSLVATSVNCRVVPGIPKTRRHLLPHLRIRPYGRYVVGLNSLFLTSIKRIWDVEDKRKQKSVIVVKSKERGARTKVTACAYSMDGNMIGGGRYSNIHI
jgi:hypothetical protein